MAQDLISLGFGGGQIIGRQADDAARTSALDQLKTMGEVAGQPARNELALFHAELYREEAAAKKHERVVAEKMQEAITRRFGSASAISVGADGTNASLASFPLVMSQIAAEAGSPEKAEKFLEAAVRTMSHEAARDSSRAKLVRDALTAQAKKMDIGGSLLNGVTDQATADEAERRYKQATGESLFEGRPYSQGLVDFMKQGALSTKEALDLRLRESEQDRRKREDSSQEALRESNRVLNEARTRLADARRDNLTKVEGKPVGSPTRTEINSALDLIRDEFKDAKLEGTSVAAVEIAARAKEMLKTNRAIPNFGVALRSAMAEAKQAGDFEKQAAGIVDSINPFAKDSIKFKGGGKTPSSALPVTPDTKNPIKGRYYSPTTGAQVGKVFQWNGSKYVLVPGVVPQQADSESSEE